MRYEREISEDTLYQFYPSMRDLIKQPVPDEFSVDLLDRLMAERERGDRKMTRDWRGKPETTATGVHWFGVYGGREGVNNALKNGWPEGLARAKKTFGDFALPHIPTVRRRRTRGDFGDNLDIHRVNSGNLDRAWDRMSRENGAMVAGSHLTVVVELTTAWFEDVDSVFWRGAATALAVDALQESGRNVQIIAVAALTELGHSKYDALEVAVEVKPFDQPMNTDAVIAATGLAGTFRTLFFHAVACSTDAPLSDSIGVVRDMSNERLTEEFGQCVIVPKDTNTKGKAQTFLDELGERY